MNTNLKSLIGKLDDHCRSALEAAAGLCLSKTNFDVDIEHLFLKLLESPDNDIARILRHFEVDATRLNRDFTRSLERLKTGNSRTPALSPNIPKIIEEAWLIASVDYGESIIRSGHLLLTIMSDESLFRLVREISKEFELISLETLKKHFNEITAGSAEEKAQYKRAAAEGAAGLPIAGGKTKALDQFTIDLTERARKGGIDPVLERDFEVRQIIDILMRRRQNNPILTGEAGVGKTAVVEGFALRIVQNDVPEPLKNVAVKVLDLGLLQAGAGIKGEFENRLKSVIEEVKASPQPIILFIDEAHTMIGAGGQAGQSDAANLLKPALARGELRTIAATTWAEYKKYFEKDAALARRFQVVKVEEPNEEQAIVMMRGLVSMLEKHHKVRILDEAVISAVKLSHRYITGRQLPDKSVSVLDTACARVAIAQAAIPASLEHAQHTLDQLIKEEDALKREANTGSDHTKRLAKIATDMNTMAAMVTTLKDQWEKEIKLIEQIKKLRATLEAEVSHGNEKASEKEIALTDVRMQLEQLNRELNAVQGESPLMQPCVDAQTIAEVISGWTGIPVGKMLTDEIKTVLTMKERLEQRVIGQSHALEAISQRIRTARANLTDPRRPIGVFLLVGPSGVGKTETGLALAELLYGGERNLVALNMSEYQESYTVSSLKGSPPGYVGYGEGGVLTEAVRRKPYSVILLDEVEKAHADVMELFYQVFDKGVLEDAEGREIDFKNTVILLTSNAGTDTIMKLCADPDTTPMPDKLVEALRPELIKIFKPALLGRMITVPYYPISDAVMRLIIKLQLGRISKRLMENHNALFTYDDNVISEVANRCTEVESGARNVDHILTGTVLPEIAGEFLARMAAHQPISRVNVSIGEAGKFAYEIS